MEQHYLNTNLVLETSMDVLCPPHELCYRSVSHRRTRPHKIAPFPN